MAMVVDLPMDQGSVWAFKIKTFEPGKTIVRPIDPTDKIEMQIRSAIDDSVLATLTTDNGKITVTDGPNGEARGDLNAIETAAIGVNGVYDIEFLPGGDASAAYRMFQGSIPVDLEVTRL